MMAIQYRPLDRFNNEIRLLKLLPRAHNEKHKFIPACHIFHASLPEKPQFVALSYVWGNLGRKRVILVENLPVFVTENLHDATMALRPVGEHLIIWIDFLCIDQTNDQEKSWQVELMKDVYRQARQVFAWLERAHSNSDHVMDYLNTFGAKAEVCGIDNVEGHHLEIWRSLASLKAAAHNPMQSNDLLVTETGDLRIICRRELNSLFYSISGWHQQDNLLPILGMQRFFTRPWWGRIWVLQEITLPENAEFVCGTKRLSRRRCSAAINAYAALWVILMQKALNSLPSTTEYHLAITTRLFRHRPNVMLSSWRIYRYSRFPLAALLRATCVGSINLRRHGPHHLESTDPRDKIFALLSLASDREKLKRRGIFLDYTKSCAEVYTSAMAALLQQGHMSLLSLCQEPKLQSGLPSWVPDWSRSATDMFQDVENDHITLYPEFRASGVESQFSKDTITRTIGSIQGISVCGMVYDEIHAVGSFPRRASSLEVPLSETWSWPKKWLAEILRLSYHNKQRYGDFSARVGAAVRTSIGGVGWNRDAKLIRVGDDRFSDGVMLVKNGMLYITESHVRLDVEQFLANKAIKAILKGRTAGDTRLGSEIIGKSLGRLPFVTRKGHLVLSSEQVRQGDFVALIKGSQVPFVLRCQTSGAYKLVSEAYVDGIMDGEGAEKSKFGNIELI